MARRIIHIEPTHEQWAAIDYIYSGYTPFIAEATDEEGEPTGEIWAERVVDDSIVQLFTIALDGSYAYEELEGLHQGWTRYGEDGEQVCADDSE